MPFLRIIHRFTLFDLLVTIAEGVVLFTFVFLLKRIFNLTDLFVAEGATFFSICKLLFSLLPSIMLLTFPMAVLLASMLVYGRMAHDNEMTALFSCGYSVSQMLIPALIIGILLTSILSWWGHRIAPKGLRLFRTVAADILRDTATTGIRPGSFNRLGSFIFLPSGIESGHMRNLRMFEERGDSIAGVISSPSAAIAFSPEESTMYLDLENGVLHQVPAPDRDVLIHFDKMHFSIQIPTLLRRLIRTGREEQRFGSRQLEDSIKYYHQQFVKFNRDFDNPNARMSFEMWKRCELEQARRIALPFACLIMAVTGALLGMSSKFGRRSSCYAMTILIIFLYYILLNFGKTYVEEDSLPAFIGLWLPNLASLAVVGYLYIRTLKV